MVTMTEAMVGSRPTLKLWPDRLSEWGLCWCGLLVWSVLSGQVTLENCVVVEDPVRGAAKLQPRGFTDWTKDEVCHGLIRQHHREYSIIAVQDPAADLHCHAYLLGTA